MQAQFDRLAPSLQRLHSPLRDFAASGEGEVLRGHHPLARLVAVMMRFPPAGHYPLHVHIEEGDGAETWSRDFGGHRFASRLSFRNGRVVERFGPFRFAFDLTADDRGGLAMHICRWSLFGVPLPLSLAPRSEAREFEQDGRFHFDVPISLPLIGLVVHYQGWLK